MPIFDQGYQHWTGELSGHAWRWLAISRHGVRTGMKNRVLRIVLLCAWLPAVVLASAVCLWGLVERKSDLVKPVVDLLVSIQLLDARLAADPRHYRVEVWTLCYSFFLSIELYLSMILVLLIGPSLISQDLRFNALPLYLSRPLRRIDYFVGKVGIIAAFLGMVMIVPSLVAYALGLLFSLDITIIRDTFRLLLSVVAYGAIIAVSAGLLILALSSLSRSSRYVGLFWIGIWFVGGITGIILGEVNREQRLHAHYRRTAVGQPINQQKAWADFQAEESQAAKKDWTPLVSYTANLSRLGNQIIGTDSAWAKLAEMQPPTERERFMAENAGTQFPWYWSAAVLAGLFGLSACILNFRIKSLDRLR